jgi:hypothetical protein
VRRDARVVGVLTLTWALSPGLARADEPPKPDLVFVADPKLGMEGGIRTSLSLGLIVSRYEELLPRIVHLESPAADHAIGVFGRLLQEVFIDDPLASVETTFIHEVYGHGARARELGQDASYEFALPEPYAAMFSPGTPFLGITETNSNTGVRDRDIVIVEAGLEANNFTTRWINLQLVAMDGWVKTSDLDVYIDSKLPYLQTFLSRGIGHGIGGGDDVIAYVNDLQDRTNRWTASDRTAIAGRLQTAYAWNYVDPTLYFAVYGLLVDRLYLGKEYSRVPLPSAGGVTFYPATRFNLSPFGAEHYLDVFLKRKHLVADVYGRIGSSGLASYTGGGVQLDGIEPRRGLRFGASADVWSQPELFLSQRNVYAPPQQAGVSAGLYASARVYESLSLTVKLACKTSGYLMGQPVDGGPYGYLGFSINE